MRAWRSPPSAPVAGPSRVAHSRGGCRCAGFGDAFWRAYHDALPRAPGFEKRAALYRAYHILNHANMFGGSYLGEATRLLQSLL